MTETLCGIDPLRFCRGDKLFLLQCSSVYMDGYSMFKGEQREEFCIRTCEEVGAKLYLCAKSLQLCTTLQHYGL